jgi:peptidoglycan/xylan/chitin deacetylase (PgdA/CDA1 family)
VKNNCTIINYHYVRDTQNVPPSKLKARSIIEFKNQIEYLNKYYHFVTINDCIDAMDCTIELPRNSALLTFDDGYIDHYENVFPLLEEKNIKGCFFIPSKVLIKRKVLDVNKIHFLLATIDDTKKLIKIIFDYLDNFRKEYVLESNEHLFKKLGHANRWDSKEVRFIKLLLQTELKPRLRKKIIDKLFATYVTNDEVAFAEKLYVSIDQVKEMVTREMCIGWHGNEHTRMSQLSNKDQDKEINEASDFFNVIDSKNQSFIISYPYGDYSDSLINKLKKNNFDIGLTIKVGIAQLNKKNIFELPRLDTNDFPTDINAPPNQWVNKVING